MNDFFRRNHDEVARDLLGRAVQLGDRLFHVFGAKGFPKERNDGLYERVTTMEPGGVFCPRYRNSELLLVACLSGGQIGGCVLIDGIEFIGGGPVNGAGRVTQALGINTHGLTGTITSNGEVFQLVLDGADPPPPMAPPPVKKDGTVSEAEVQRRMPLIIKAYLKRRKADDKLTFEAFLAECFACKTPRELGMKLNDA